MTTNRFFARYEKIIAAYAAELDGRNPSDISIFDLTPAIFKAVPDATLDEIVDALEWSARQHEIEAQELRRLRQRP
jgi:hypothetical protein